ncbi:hypothetical protein BO71DRAFT_12508 [Aspergillus ellipticus CBS 707.79]|uniref:Uncharacterized protein n=1 Tax=Aspergillus ellipticus CBS 707.79 TaxID=1448320 RepID=A0A319D6F5_9EURO|nr:hypothetical protein BO71DRAFT_12508 [Aspergillus ellipticus CBS 707.79]
MCGPAGRQSINQFNQSVSKNQILWSVPAAAPPRSLLRVVMCVCMCVCVCVCVCVYVCVRCPVSSFWTCPGGGVPLRQDGSSWTTAVSNFVPSRAPTACR